MAKERAFSYRNTAAQGEAPVWEKWFMKTVADAVMMSDGDDEDENIVQYVERKINELIGGAPGTYDTLKEIADYIAEHEDVTEALNEAITSKADKTAATTTAAGLMSAADKVKLEGIATGANKYTHPTTSGNKHIPTGGSSGKILGWKADGEAQWVDDKNTTYSAFKGATSAAAGGTGLVPAPAAGDQEKFLSGDGTWKTPEQATYNEATTTTAGLMSAADKIKLDGVATGANKYTHPTTSGNKHIPTGGASGQILKYKADGEAQWAAEKSYSNATQSTAGLMSTADKTKLDGVAEGANKYTHPSNHAASMITQDSTHRFVTDTEKASWNAKPEIYFAEELPENAPAGSICFLI